MRLITCLATLLALSTSLYAQSANKAPKLQEDDFSWESRPRPKQERTEYWDFVGTAPYATGRNNVWHSMVHIPAMTDASPYPQGAFALGINTEWTYADWSDSSQAGVSAWKAVTVEETITADYGVTDSILIGARLTTGELFQQESNDRITLYDGNSQIVADNDRSFAVESLVLLGRIVGDLGFADGGIQIDAKIPLANEDTLLTSQSFDIGVTGLLSAEVGDFIITLNGGVVVPIGDSDLFLDDSKNEMDTIVHGAVAVTYEVFTDLVAGIQVEGNTSPFGAIDILDEMALGVYASIRYRMMKYHRRQKLLYRTEEGFFGVLIGTGFGDLGNDFTLGLNLDFSF